MQGLNLEDFSFKRGLFIIDTNLLSSNIKRLIQCDYDQRYCNEHHVFSYAGRQVSPGENSNSRVHSIHLIPSRDLIKELTCNMNLADKVLDFQIPILKNHALREEILDAEDSNSCTHHSAAALQFYSKMTDSCLLGLTSNLKQHFALEKKSNIHTLLRNIVASNCKEEPYYPTLKIHIAVFKHIIKNHASLLRKIDEKCDIDFHCPKQFIMKTGNPQSPNSSCLSTSKPLRKEILDIGRYVCSLAARTLMFKLLYDTLHQDMSDIMSEESILTPDGFDEKFLELRLLLEYYEIIISEMKQRKENAGSFLQDVISLAKEECFSIYLDEIFLPIIRRVRNCKLSLELIIRLAKFKKHQIGCFYEAFHVLRYLEAENEGKQTV